MILFSNFCLVVVCLHQKRRDLPRPIVWEQKVLNIALNSRKSVQLPGRLNLILVIGINGLIHVYLSQFDF